MRRLHCLLLAGLAGVISSTAIAAQSPGAAPPPDLYGALHWRHIGPEGNRFSAAGRSRRSAHLLRGCRIRRIYKTSDGGVTWKPVFDAQPVQS